MKKGKAAIEEKKILKVKPNDEIKSVKVVLKALLWSNPVLFKTDSSFSLASENEE